MIDANLALELSALYPLRGALQLGLAQEEDEDQHEGRYDGEVRHLSCAVDALHQAQQRDQPRQQHNIIIFNATLL